MCQPKEHFQQLPQNYSATCIVFTFVHESLHKAQLSLEIERTDRCCSETESVTAQICSGRNQTEPNHTQIRARCRGSLTPQTRDVQILKCCVRISPRILTTDPHPHPPLQTQAPSRSRVSSPSEPGKLGH